MFSQNRIAMICNAPLESTSKIKEKITTFPVLIAVNGGINHCYQLDLHPDLIVGDFDSADPMMLKKFDNVVKRHFPKDKDKTDLEIALELVFHAQIEEITIFGAIGGRTDHTLGNLVLLSRYPGKVFLETDRERMFVIDRQVEIIAYPGQLISLIPLNGPVKGIDTEGLKWKLNNGTLDKQFIGISNQAMSKQVQISVKEGDLLCCLNT
ncbi:MAG: thiamine diphosphokinase [Rhabdochlamydiaceae bacterium]|jgi:thiamine pyrophosphokinase